MLDCISKKKIIYFFNESHEFLNRNLNSLYYLFKRIYFYSRTFINPREKNEYEVIKRLQILSALPEGELAGRHHEIATVIDRVNRLFEDNIIQRHSIRLESPQNWEQFQKFEREERAYVRLHELTEILFLKWDCGKDFDESARPYFWYAHTKAIQVENLYKIIEAQKMGIPLTLKSLQYIRVVDELALHGITFIQKEEDIPYAVEILTRNRQNLPPMQEMVNYMRFMLESGLHRSEGKESICNKVWNRYFFTVLYAQYQNSPNHIKVIFLLLYYNQTQKYYEGHHPQVLLDGMTKVLAELSEDDLRLLTLPHNYFDQMEEIYRREEYNCYLTSLITAFHERLC